MSVCRSEPLFSSMRDSEMQSELNKSETNGGVSHGGILKVHGASGLEPHRGPTQDSLIQDSLTDEDFNFGEKVTVNKNNYTLTYSGQGVIGSFIASMVSSTGAILEPQGKKAKAKSQGKHHYRAHSGIHIASSFRHQRQNAIIGALCKVCNFDRKIVKCIFLLGRKYRMLITTESVFRSLLLWESFFRQKMHRGQLMFRNCFWLSSLVDKQ